MGGIDFSVWKIYCTARNTTDEPTFYSDLNVTFTVTKERLVNEVKKMGVIIDRGMEMQLRAGDQMVIYVSMGGFEK